MRGRAGADYSRPMPRPPTKKESNAGLYAALGAAGAVLVIALAVVGLRKPLPPPPPPPRPRTTGSVSTVREALRGSENFYKATVEDDARKFGLPTPTLDQLAAPLPRSVELDLPRTLAPGQSIETPHLEIKVEVAKEWSGAGGSGYRFEHLVLSIANRGQTPLAYRVDTAVPDPSRCRKKGAIAQNAIALEPGEHIRRTECVLHPGVSVTVTHVETIELLPLEYDYVTRLLPDQLGLDGRTAEGHVPAKGRPCQFVPWRDIQSGGAGWADVIDFYARHNCDEYTIYGGYRLRTEAGPLPAIERPEAKLAGSD